jgi:hypothetical protein
MARTSSASPWTTQNIGSEGDLLSPIGHKIQSPWPASEEQQIEPVVDQYSQLNDTDPRRKSRGNPSMTIRTVARPLDTYDDGKVVVNDFEAAGIRHANLSIVWDNRDGRRALGEAGPSWAVKGIEAGAMFGGVFGGASGLIAGLGLLVISSAAPVLTVGWLAVAVAGAAAGAAVGGAAGSIVANSLDPS